MKYLYRILNFLFFATLLTAALFATTAAALNFETSAEPTLPSLVREEAGFFGDSPFELPESFTEFAFAPGEKPSSFTYHPQTDDDASASLSSVFLSGDGTAESPYLLSGADDLECFSSTINSDTTGAYTKAYYKLTADINLNGAEWMPVGYYAAETEYSTAFQGVFDGDGHTVSNFVITEDCVYAGFFGLVYNGTVKNLTISNAKISLSTNNVLYAGMLVGRCLTYGNKKTALIENCHVKDVALLAESKAYSVYTGGLAGYLYASQGASLRVNGCSADAEITGKSSGYSPSASSDTRFNLTLGGFAGYVGSRDADSTLVIANSYSLSRVNGISTVTRSKSDNLKAGGFIGYFASAAGASIQLSGCYSAGGVVTEAIAENYSGGLLGYLVASASGVFIENCYTSSNVYGKSTANTAYLGGFSSVVGSSSNADFSLESCYASGNVIDSTSCASEGGRFVADAQGNMSTFGLYTHESSLLACDTVFAFLDKQLTAEQACNLSYYTGFSNAIWKNGSESYPYPVFINSSVSIDLNTNYIIVGETVTITGCDSAATWTVIPEAIDGYPVTEIAIAAFWRREALVGISIPKSVKSIGKYAFSGCTNLTSITIPDSVMVIGEFAFSETPWYHSKPDGLIYINKVLYEYKGTMPKNTKIDIKPGTISISAGAFFGNTNLVGITIPCSVTSIGKDAFSGCSSLSEVVLEKGITKIDSYSFRDCTGLESITIPGSVKSIGDSAFSGCSDLANITIPSSVESIGKDAFSGCSSLSEIVLEKGITKIDSYSFRDCTGLTSITIPDSVTSISEAAFSGCSNLKDIYYAGSPSQWNQIQFTSNATVHCTKCGENLTWSLDKSSGVLTISGTGKMYEYSSNTTPWYNDCGTVKSVVLSDGVTSIGGSAFFGCTNLTSIVIPDSVTSIGTSAFSDCTGLTSITIPSGVTSIEQFVFSDCTSLISITIPNRVTRIRRGAFSDCTGLTSITISDSVTSIEDFAFSGCTGLVSITIPGSVKSIGNSPFSGCTSLSEIILEKGITKIDSNSFRDCTGLTSITIPDSVTSISEAAFSGCSNLKDIYYTGSPSQWKQISIGSNNNEFRRATVHYVKFGENLKWSFDKETGTLTISGTGEMYAFNYAKEFPWHGERSEITSVVLEEGVANIGGSAFYGCTNLVNVVIPSSVTSIGNSAFSGCTGLSSVSIPDSVTSIGSYAFSGCTALTSLKIPEGVTTIAGYTFDSCTNLTSLSIPNSLTSVDTYAFKDCTSLKDIYYNGTPSEWNQISYNGNYIIREASIHYARCGKNVDWSFDKKTGTLTISGNGAIEDIDKKDCTPWHDERSNIQTIVIKNGVTDIGTCVFCGYTNLTSITIPSSVKRLGDSAFGECSNLEFVDIQDLASWCGIEFGWYMANPLSLGAILYVNGKKAVDLIIPEGVTEISPYAFVGYESLASVTFPNSLQSIGEKAFAQCTNLKNVVIPDSVKAIRCNAFYACTNLSSISIGSGVEYIEDNFSECPNLTAVHIKDVAAWCGIEFTSEAANPLCCTDATLYVNGEAVTDIVIPDGVQSISCGAFWGYDKMTSVTIPASVTSIPSAFAVSEDSNFNAVYINDLAAWCSIDFSYPEENPLIYAHNLYVNGKLLEQLTIPDGTTTFSAPYAFSGANCIKSVVIPKTLTNIAKNTFYACNNIKDIYYTGSAEEWESVRIAANNGTLSEATVHIAYEVVFDANTDEPVSGLSETTFAYDSFTLPTAIPSRVNYKFLGWSTVPDGKAICQPGDMVEISADTTFYAVWAEADKAVLSGITLKNTSYDPISAIPVGDFIAEVALTNNTYNGVCNVLLATYDKDGRMLHIRYLYATPAVGQTISFGTELSNADGKIAKIKAFVLSDLRAFTILGEAAELTKA